MGVGHTIATVLLVKGNVGIYICLFNAPGLGVWTVLLATFFIYVIKMWSSVL